MNEIIEELKHGIMICDTTGTSLVHVKRTTAENIITILMEQTQPKWVSVNDRLPRDGQDVLAYLYNGEETRIAPFNYDKGTWYDCVMDCTVAINSITHWMPLPESPKEVSE